LIASAIAIKSQSFSILDENGITMLNPYMGNLIMVNCDTYFCMSGFVLIIYYLAHVDLKMITLSTADREEFLS
jgi:hypothetical protein